MEADALEIEALLRKQKWLDDAVVRQSQLYQRRDGRVQVLAAVNALLVAASSFFFKDGAKTEFAMISGVACLILVSAALVFALWSFRPIFSSGVSRGAAPNLRSVQGIQSFRDWMTFERAVIAASDLGHFQNTVRQLYGMSRVVKRTYLAMAVAVVFTMLAAVSLCVAGVAQLTASSLDGSARHHSGSSSQAGVMSARCASHPCGANSP